MRADATFLSGELGSGATLILLTPILAQQAGYRAAGGKFIVPIPEVRVI